MNDKTVLLNGGRALDVTPVDGAAQFLAQLLGAAPSRPAIPSLRLVDDPAGARCVGVFIANTHVGYLLNQVDEGLVATLQACEHHNAVARARATLMAEWDDPETPVLKVDLAESDLLLTEPSSLAQSPALPQAAASVAEPGFAALQAPPSPVAQESTPAPPQEIEPWDVSPDDDSWSARSKRDLDAALADETVTAESIDFLADDPAPVLAAGYTEDYPDWPPRNPQASAAFGAAPAPAAAGPPPTEGYSAQPDALPETILAPAGAPSAAVPTASPQAPQSTRSAWFGAMPMPEVAPQAGWLASPQRSAADGPQPSAQPFSTGQMGPSQQTGWQAAQQLAASAGGETTGAASAPPAQDGSWQEHADRSRDPESQFVTGWTSGATQARPVSEVRIAGMSDKNKAWLVSVLAVVVLATAGFLIWKTMFAPKNYTDDQYGYSFSYPGRWEFMEESGTLPFTDLAALGAGGMILDLAMAAHGDSEENIAALGVCVVDASSLYLDASRLQTDLQTNLAMAVSQDPSIAVVEPVHSVTFEGVPGCRCAISVTYMGFSATISYGILVDGDLLYVLMGFAPESSWSDNQGAFEDFFKSFKPATTRM